MWKLQQFYKIFRFAVFVFAAYSQLVSGGATLEDDVTRDTELRFAFMVHRHGDRTICSVKDKKYTDKPDAVLQATREYGFGQLTLQGRQTAYKLGEFIRDRYSELLAPKFNRSEVFIRSTDCTRTKMTTLTALAAIYPPAEPRWSDTVNWEPVPYTTVQVLYDFNDAILNCPKFTKRMNIIYKQCPTEMTKFSTLLEQLTALLGKNFSATPLAVVLVANVLEAQLSLGIPLSHDLQEIYDQIKEAADVATDYIHTQEEILDLQAGPLLNDFSKQASLIIAGTPTHKLRIYSAHDLNVYALEAIIKATNKQGFPQFAALLSLELRRNIKTGEYVVLPVYLPAPGEPPVYLNIAGCDSLPCNYDQFLQITAPYVLDEKSWRTKCEWTPDLVIDDSKKQ